MSIDSAVQHSEVINAVVNMVKMNSDIGRWRMGKWQIRGSTIEHESVGRATDFLLHLWTRRWVFRPSDGPFKFGLKSHSNGVSIRPFGASFVLG